MKPLSPLPRLRTAPKAPLMTLKILGLCVFLQVVQSYFPSFIDLQAFYPDYLHSLLTVPLYLFGLLVHMFSHGGWGHLLSNFTIGLPCLLYLENRIGSNSLLNLFLITGVAAAVTQSCMPTAGYAMIGSSGAVMGLYGAACMTYGSNSPVRMLIGLGLLGLELMPQLIMLNMGPMGGTVAYGAHIGGCVAGMVWVLCRLAFNRKECLKDKVS